MSDPTAVFSIYDERDREIRAVVQEVYDALKEKGYNPINQLVGYKIGRASCRERV